ncbi:exosortase O [Chlorogloea sp. CCALA 695]|uniref:exosortase O n=1 Tax=Chlorogloea sp. CCALA 695 TaxID=2107693 RepID=UPI000D07F9FE|nr:exosortase O [Chlorogloea sp. CCALA 695]PSB35283.1 exosortase O [Chlorogloea sp. CCALA 695]
MTLTHSDTPPKMANWSVLIATGLIGFAWLVLNYTALQWLFASFSNTSIFNLIIFGVVATILLVQAIHHRRKLGLSATPRLHPAPLILMFGSTVTRIGLQWLLDVPQIGVLLFAIASYGLIGLFIAPNVWRKGLPAAIFAACILPFSVQFGTGLGFPVRVITAQLVEHILAFWHIAAISSHDIIVLENSIAQVDLPCSGLKSLWTGTLFLLAATWLENRLLRFKWLLVCVTNILLLIAANTGRILLLVLISNVGDRPDLAAILHVPLGLIGFITAGLFSWLLLQTVPRHKNTPPKAETLKTPPLGNLKPLTQQIIVGSCILGLALIPHPRMVTTSAIASINLPAQMNSEPLQLSAIEKDFFANYEGAIAQKSRFEWQNMAGSILLVSSNSVQAYHAPELCLVGNGLKIDTMKPLQLSPQVLGRWISINNGTMAATYWFQSPKHTTDDFLTRLWGGMTRKDRLWVMVSVLFDRSQQPDTPEIQAFTTNIHDAIASSLTGV